MRVPRPRPAVRSRPRSLAGQLFAMQVVLVTVVVAGCALFAYLSGKAQASQSATHRARATTQAVADSPSVRDAIRSPHPSRRLQPYAEETRRDTGVTFITIMDTDGTRWTHPEPDRIGERFVGHIGPALEGRTFDETYTGTLGPSVRVVTPVRDGGRIVGLVSAGIAVDTISEQVSDQLAALLAVAGGALALGGLGTYVVNARLRRHTHGMNAAELSRLYDYHQATLHAVREGLLLLDGHARVALVNDGARTLLGLTERGEVVGSPVTALGLPRELTDALSGAEARVDEVHLTDQRVIVVNTSPIAGRGTVVTLRDHTELRALTGELDSVRGFAEALRSQAHEAANRLHTVVSLIELGRVRDAVDFATEELELAQALTDRVVSAVAEPVLAALLLGKAAQAHERGVDLTLSEDSHVDDTSGLPARDLVTVLGNLIDNAVEAAAPGGAGAPESEPGAAPGARGKAGPAGGTPRVTVTVAVEETPTRRLLLRVADNGPGLPSGAGGALFERGWTTKSGGGGIGLALVRQTARRHGGDVHARDLRPAGAEFTVRLPCAQEGARS
ncbi:sensor histidine kinase [Streptomyces diacarni]|uniref:histidine kinase n=1 Tax=Streptomyces diacarni TaxID=2800381 RepID=A0A367EPV9_9ACTN|nr:sensor histidine kinase [Streptomyces diacarni]RCG19742.1 sensor histidine kinase [Streptomyces diacarni]